MPTAMPRYYFPTWQADRRIQDDEGVELATTGEALVLAAQSLGDLARDLLFGAAETGLAMGVDVVRADGVVLARLRLDYRLERTDPDARAS